MKPPAASPGRAEKPQLAAPGLARLLLSKSRRGARSRRAPPATSPMFVSRGARTRAANDGEPSSPKVTCIGQVRMRKGKKPATATAPAVGKAAARDKGAARGGYYYYCRCLKRAFLCGGLFASDARKRRHEPPAERGRRSPWVFSSRDVAVAAAPKPPADPSSGRRAEDEVQLGVGDLGSTGRDGEQEVGIGSEQGGDGERDAPLAVSSATTTPKNALLLMRCRSAPQNRTSPLTSRFPSTAAAPTPAPAWDALAAAASPLASPSPSPSPRKAPASANEDGVATQQTGAVAAPAREPQLVLGGEGEEEEEVEVEVEDDNEFDEYDEDEEEEDETVRCSSARPLVLQRCKSEPATTAAAKMAAGPATSAGCFWAHGGSGGRRRHAPPPPAAAPAAVALTGH
jgi:hypothetical protein